MTRRAPSTLVISDANVLLDMDAGGLLEPMFRLGLRFAAPDVLIARELQREEARLRDLGLRVLEVRSEGVKYMETLAADAASRGVGRLDLFAVALCRQENGTLLTGDARLRVLAERESLEVHGTLWLVDTLIAARRIRAPRVRRSYAAMREVGRRLPWDEVERQIRKYERGQ